MNQRVNQMTDGLVVSVNHNRSLTATSLAFSIFFDIFYGRLLINFKDIQVITTKRNDDELITNLNIFLQCLLC